MDNCYLLSHIHLQTPKFGATLSMTLVSLMARLVSPSQSYRWQTFDYLFYDLIYYPSGIYMIQCPPNCHEHGLTHTHTHAHTFV